MWLISRLCSFMHSSSLPLFVRITTTAVLGSPLGFTSACNSRGRQRTSRASGTDRSMYSTARSAVGQVGSGSVEQADKIAVKLAAHVTLNDFCLHICYHDRRSTPDFV